MKLKQKIAGALIAGASIFSTGCDLDEYTSFLDTANFGDKSSFVERASNEPPLFRIFDYYIRRPGVDSRGLHFNATSSSNNYHIRPRWPLLYIRNPITDEVLRQTENYLGRYNRVSSVRV